MPLGEVLMRGSRFAPLAWIVLLVDSGTTRSDPIEDARKVIAAGIKAQGGEIKLVRYKALVCKAEGTLHVDGRSVPCTIRVVFQPPFQHAQVLSGSGFKVTTVLNGDRAWRNANGVVAELDKEQVREYKQILFSEQASGLTPLLKCKEAVLSLLAESKIEGVHCVGVKVRCKNYRDVLLFFDRKTALLVKTEMVVKDKGTFFTQETFFHDYEDFGGLRRPRRVITTRDKQEYMSWEVIENKALDKKVSDLHFARPGR
jgi:hypothetical protein